MNYIINNILDNMIKNYNRLKSKLNNLVYKYYQNFNIIACFLYIK